MLEQTCMNRSTTMRRNKQSPLSLTPRWASPRRILMGKGKGVRLIERNHLNMAVMEGWPGQVVKRVVRAIRTLVCPPKDISWPNKSRKSSRNLLAISNCMRKVLSKGRFCASRSSILKKSKHLIFSSFSLKTTWHLEKFLLRPLLNLVFKGQISTKFLAEKY